MLTKFQKRLSKYDLTPEKKLLLAASGGVDSMVLLDLFTKNRINFAVAHCNFSLRGTQSDADQNFVENHCKKNNIPFFTKKFDTEKYALQNKKSIQITARMLRYDWFFKLKNQHPFDYIATAHHLDDDLETFLINLLRGTGIEGLSGIPENNEIIRPLLGFSKEEIEKYAIENHLKWREDSSNHSDKYLRNNIRHNIVPLFKELNPNFLGSFSKTIAHLKEIQTFSDDVSKAILNELITKKNDAIFLKINELLNQKNPNFILYKWLSNYGFTAWDDVYNLVYSQSGKFVETENFKLLKNRNELILSKKNKEINENVFFISSEQVKIEHPIKLQLITKNKSYFNIKSQNIAYIDKSLLKFPLTIRKYKEGEYFCPFGMDGKRKKISKFFKDEKFSALEKEKTWILYSDNQVVWIIGKRLDERFKITSNTTSILKIVFG